MAVGPSGVAYFAGELHGSDVNHEPFTAIPADAAGNVFAAGQLVGGVEDDGASPVTEKGMGDMLLMKLGPDGEQLWVKRFGDAAAQTLAAVAVAPDGTVAVGGDGKGKVDFGSGPLVASSYAGFVAKLPP